MDIIATKYIDRDLAERIITDYNNNLTIRTISQKYNLKYNRVNKVLTKNNTTKRSSSENNRLADYKKSCKPHFLDINPEISDKLKVLYSEGTSLTDIGKVFNVSHVTIKKWLLKLNVKLRTLAEANSRDVAKTKRKNSLQQRYGVDNPMQVLDIHLKAMKSGYRVKTINIGDLQFNVQGYEPQALEYLASIGVDISKLSVGKDVPVISYEYKKQHKKYFPDIYHKDTNIMYEIKSKWTYSQQKSKNIAKAKATAAAGYKHVTLIFDNKGKELLDVITTNLEF